MNRYTRTFLCEKQRDLTVLYSNKSVTGPSHWRAASVEGPSVHVGIGQEVSQLVTVLVVVKRPETLVTEETRLTGSELVVGGKPSAETKDGRCSLKKARAVTSCICTCFNTHLPMKTWQTAHFCVVTLCLWVRSGYSSLSRQSFLWVSLQTWEGGGEEEKKEGPGPFLRGCKWCEHRFVSHL